MNDFGISRRRESVPGSLAPLVLAGEDLIRGVGGSGVDDLSQQGPGEAHGGGRQTRGDEEFFATAWRVQ